MKKIKWILAALGLAALLIGAVFGYRALSESYNAPKEPEQTTAPSREAVQTAEQTEAPSGETVQTGGQTEAPTETPTEAQLSGQTQPPTQAPTEKPTQAPTEKPTQAPTEKPTQAPTEKPTQAPTEKPTQAPTEKPTQAPTEKPTQAPTEKPTEPPTEKPTEPPTEPVEKAADFTVTNAAGEKVKLSSFFGKPIVVNFWASWCYPCKSELPSFNSAYQTYKGKVTFLMVNLTDGNRETIEGVSAFVAENGYSFPVYFDTTDSAANAYAVYSIPLTVFINRDGSVADTHLGAMSSDKLTGYIEGMLD